MIRRKVAEQKVQVNGQWKRVEIVKQYNEYVILVDGEKHAVVDDYESMKVVLKEIANDD